MPRIVSCPGCRAQVEVPDDGEPEVAHYDLHALHEQDAPSVDPATTTGNGTPPGTVPEVPAEIVKRKPWWEPTTVLDEP